MTAKNMNKNAESFLGLLAKSLVIGRVKHVERVQTGCYSSSGRTQTHDTITWVLQGGYQLYWGGKQGAWVGEGSGVVIPAGILRHSKWKSGKTPIIIRSMRLECSIGESGINLLSLFETPTLLPKAVIPVLNDCFDRFSASVQETEERKTGSDLMHIGSRLPFKEIMAEKEAAIKILQTIMPVLKLRHDRLNNISKIEQLLIYLRNLKGKTISVEEMAQICNLSVSRFHRVFKAATNLTPQAYARKARLNLAAELLQEGRETLARIASETGFSDEFHLSRHFRRAFGVPPSEFRRNPQVDLL